LVKEEEKVAFGKVPAEQFKQLGKLLEDSDFLVISGSHGSLIPQQSPTFGAGIYRDDGAQRFQWANQEGGSPSPNPAAKVVN
jgi:hypothetical protein